MDFEACPYDSDEVGIVGLWRHCCCYSGRSCHGCEAAAAAAAASAAAGDDHDHDDDHDDDDVIVVFDDEEAMVMMACGRSNHL